MQNNNELIDILGAIELPDEILNKTEKTFEPKKMLKSTFTVKINFPKKKEKTEKIEKIEKYNNFSIISLFKGNKDNIDKNKKNVKEKSKLYMQFFHAWIFWIKYIFTSVAIFAVLLLTTNFSAYSNIVSSYVFQEQHQKKANLLLNSVNASEIKEKKIVYKKTKFERIEEFKLKTKKAEKIKNKFSIKQIISNSEKKDIDLWINIVP